MLILKVLFAITYGISLLVIACNLRNSEEDVIAKSRVDIATPFCAVSIMGMAYLAITSQIP